MRQTNNIPDNTGAEKETRAKRTAAVNGYRKLARILLLFVAVLFVRTYVFSFVTVVGNSMNDTFHQGDVLLSVCDTSDLQRYDVVVARAMDQRIIKRIIGLPGETIQICDGMVYIDGEKLTGEFAFYTSDAGIAGAGYVLGENEYFLMGDNREVSADSRDCGGVSITEIQGRVVFQLLPLRSCGRISR